jgi:apolipoprotein D and lipocalin family protein
MKIAAALAVMLAVAAGACARDEKKPVQTVSRVDLSRYVGTWYEIARYPNRFQRDCEGNVTANYTLREDGNITVVNSCKEAGEAEPKVAKGKAKIVDKETNARL